MDISQANETLVGHNSLRSTNFYSQAVIYAYFVNIGRVVAWPAPPPLLRNFSIEFFEVIFVLLIIMEDTHACCHRKLPGKGRSYMQVLQRAVAKNEIKMNENCISVAIAI